MTHGSLLGEMSELEQAGYHVIAEVDILELSSSAIRMRKLPKIYALNLGYCTIQAR